MSVGPEPGTSFLPRLAGFVGFLRGRGLAVGTGAAIDCANALRTISLLDRGTFLAACTVTLAKSPEEVARLTEAFALYWNVDLDSLVARTPHAPSIPPSPPPDGLAPVQGDHRGMRMTVDRAGAIRIGVYSPDAPSAGHRLVPVPSNRVLAIRAGARRLRRFTATRAGRRATPARHGKIDFPGTARHSLREGGEWIEFRFRKPKIRRAELFVLWDVSGSMREHDADLFAIVHALQRVNRRSRIFAFGTQLEEITESFRGRPYVIAARAVSEDLEAVGGGTRIGTCLEAFLRKYGQQLSRKSTLVVLSDGWDLDDSAGLGRVMERLHRRCHRIVWVNPHADDPRFEPATAGMREALPHVDLLLGAADFESRTGLAPERLAFRRPALRVPLWGKAFIAAP